MARDTNAYVRNTKKLPGLSVKRGGIGNVTCQLVWPEVSIEYKDPVKHVGPTPVSGDYAYSRIINLKPASQLKYWLSLLSISSDMFTLCTDITQCWEVSIDST